MMNSIYSLPTNLPTDFTDGIYSIGKKDTSSFFLLRFIFFPTVILSVYTDGNIPSVFPFVFIDFLIVLTHFISGINYLLFYF
jgi:hypothetical protein